MIQTWVRKLIEKYTYIEKTDIHAGYVRLFYYKNNTLVFRKLPLRANRERLQALLQAIELDSDVYKENMKIIKSKVLKKTPMVVNYDKRLEEEENSPCKNT